MPSLSDLNLIILLITSTITKLVVLTLKPFAYVGIYPVSISTILLWVVIGTIGINVSKYFLMPGLDLLNPLAKVYQEKKILRSNEVKDKIIKDRVSKDVQESSRQYGKAPWVK